MRKLLSTAAAAAALFAGVSTSANAYVIMTLNDVSSGAFVECNNFFGNCTSAATGLTTVGSFTGSFSTVQNGNFVSFQDLASGTAKVGGWEISQANTSNNVPGSSLAGNVNQTALVAFNTYNALSTFRMDVRVLDFENPTGFNQIFSGTVGVGSNTLGASVTNVGEFYASAANNPADLSNMITCQAQITDITAADSDVCDAGPKNWVRGAGQYFSLRDIQYFTATAKTNVDAFANMTTRNVPEPASLMLVGAALLALGAAARRKV